MNTLDILATGSDNSSDNKVVAWSGLWSEVLCWALSLSSGGVMTTIHPLEPLLNSSTTLAWRRFSAAMLIILHCQPLDNTLKYKVNFYVSPPFVRACFLWSKYSEYSNGD